MKKLVCIWMLHLIIGLAHSQITVTGTVKDKITGEALIALIKVKGTNPPIIAQTDTGGYFTIKVNSPKDMLEITSMSYRRKTIEVGNKDFIAVDLEVQSQMLMDVVVVSYQTRQRCMKSESSEIISSNSFPQMAVANNVYFNPSTESYAKKSENGYKIAKVSPLSTFSIDVDKASYSNVRRFINEGQTPPADAVRIEEMINYFDYAYPQPKDEHPVAIYAELASCPWNAKHKLLHIGLQGKTISAENLPPSNLVFLIDVSGSMGDANKLPLLKQAFKMLVNNLREKDKVSIVTYAGAAGLALEPTPGNKKEKILNALDRLESGGSTAGGAGIQLAYAVAKENFIKDGNNRVILATDGDFNVGVSNENELETLITEQRQSGIFLTCLGFGMGNYKDSKLEILADKGNGNYAYIDNIQEAQHELVSQFGGTLFTIAKDVKAQIEFNSIKVKKYRLIGYENRLLNTEDFKDDKKDAGEMGSGHTVTILYEIIPAGNTDEPDESADTLRYQTNTPVENEKTKNEIATIKIRYKKPDADKSIEMVMTISNKSAEYASASENLRFSASVAMFGMILTDSEFKGKSDYKSVIELAENAKNNDKEGYKSEFVRLVKSLNNI